MTVQYIKKANRTPTTDQEDVATVLHDMLAEIEAGGDEVVRRYAHKLDQWDGEIVVSKEAMETATKTVSQQSKDDILFAHDNIRPIAEATARIHAWKVWKGMPGQQIYV